MVNWRARSTSSLGREALAHADSLHNLARYLTRSETAAEDLVQETYVRALKSAAQFTPGTNLKAWLFRILRNAHLSRYRSERHDPLDPSADQGEAAEALQAGPPRDEFSLEQTRRLVAGDIEAAMAALGEDARTVILLDLEGLAEAEMALVLGCPAGTVKSRLYRARSALRERLADYASDRKPGWTART
jgi:RNA polymerase sigma-70 factor (ECF subfamily)